MPLVDRNTYEFNSLNICIAAFITLIALVGAISVLVIMLKKGNKNKEFIIKETCYKSFIVTIIILLINWIFNLLMGKQFFDSITSASIILGASTIAFNIIYYIEKSKHKD